MSGEQLEGERSDLRVTKRYWFARFGHFPRQHDRPWRPRTLLAWRRAPPEMLPQPIDQTGWLFVFVAIALMAIGGAAAIVFGLAANQPGPASLLLLLWLAICIFVFGTIMNKMCDPQKAVEDYWGEEDGNG